MPSIGRSSHTGFDLHLNDTPPGLSLKGSLAIDTETLGLQLLRDRLCLIQICDEDGTVVLVRFDGQDYSAPNLKALLLEGSRTAIFHYARFDLAALQRYLGVSMPSVFCTKIASRLVRTYTDSHGLRSLVREIVNVELDKTSQTTNWSASVLSEKQLKYAVNDVLYLHTLKDELTAILKERGRMEFAQRLFGFIGVAAELDLAGFNPADLINH